MPLYRFVCEVCGKKLSRKQKIKVMKGHRVFCQKCFADYQRQNVR